MGGKTEVEQAKNGGKIGKMNKKTTQAVRRRSLTHITATRISQVIWR